MLRLKKEKVKHDCLHCGSIFEHRRSSRNIYCSAQCQQDYQHMIALEKWLNGELSGYIGKTLQISNTVRRYLHNTRGTACEICGWDEKHPIDNRPLTEIDHIDGDAENCRPENLRILCPNCHSMTPTFRARNKGSKRNRKS